jgi:hypothetical protein
MYVNSIEEAAVVVQLPVGEVEIVNIIVEGLHPPQHSRFLFQNLHTSFGELDPLAVLKQNLAFVDQIRQRILRRVVIRRSD